MYLQHLQLLNFRNYDNLDMTFSPQINVLLGNNAQGKTNLLESIYVLALARSHRTNIERELINWHHDFARISGQVIRRIGTLPLELVITKKGKKAQINHLEQARLSQYIGNFNVILFSPEDLLLVKGSPSVRRRFINMEYGQINPQYLLISTQYRQVLKQRNKYLKKLQMHQSQDLVYLSVLSEQLAVLGAQIIMARSVFITHMNKWAAQLHQQITKKSEQLNLCYVTQVDNSIIYDGVTAVQQCLQQLYEQHQEREIERGTTLIGPHHDDIMFMINGNNVQIYGSQGQQRTTVLSAKLAEIELMHEQTGEYPVLLLDDVLSELDPLRQTYLLKTIQNKVQTFLTTPSLDDIVKKLINQPLIFQVAHGTLTKEENND